MKPGNVAALRKYHHVQRIERELAWLVIVKRSPDVYRKAFHDRRYTSKAAALAAAVAYRDRLLAAMPAGWRIHAHRSGRNRSGTIGVHLSVQRQGRRVHRFWIATWKEDGRHRRRAFSVTKLGSNEAKASAVAFRAAKVATLRGARQPPPLTRKPLSNTGILGVCRRRIAGATVYVAHWGVNGERFEKAFSARRYGNGEALALAAEARRQATMAPLT